MLSRSFVSAISRLQGSESRIISVPMRSLSLNNRGSLFRSGSCTLRRSMSNQEAASGKTGWDIEHLTTGVINEICFLQRYGVPSTFKFSLRKTEMDRLCVNLVLFTFAESGTCKLKNSSKFCLLNFTLKNTF